MSLDTTRPRRLRASAFAVLATLLVTGVVARPAAADPTPAVDPGAHGLYVATDGDDSNPGTADKPFKTINKAAQVAQPGDTVVVHAGTYRETVKPARGGTDEDHRITYTNAGDGDVVVKGSNEVDDWQEYSGDVWKVTLPNSYFGDYNPYATGQPQGGGSDVFPGYTAGDVYLSGQAYYEKPSLAQVTSSPEAWYSEVGADSTTVYANFDGADPNAKDAEINVRRQVFAPDAWGLGYITVDGFTVEQAANTYSDFPSSPSHTQAGAISVNGGFKWVIENNRVINARTIGIDIGLGNDTWAGNRPGTALTDFHDTDKYGQNIVRNNYIAKCGQSGIAGVFSWKSQILYNEIEDTNYRGEFSGAETAPIKVHYMNYGLIKGNYIKNSKGGNSAGIWTDWGSQGVRVTGNVVINTPWGYYAEAVHGPILVDNNVFIGDGDVRLLDSTGVTFAHNLFIDSGKINVDGYGRESYYFEPGTMNETTTVAGDMKNYFLNNVAQNTTLPPTTYDSGTVGRSDGSTTTVTKENVLAGNAVGPLSNVAYTATDTGVKLDFDYDGSGVAGVTPVTKDRIGLIPDANEEIPADVTGDYFDVAHDDSALKPGPFSSTTDGANSVTLWPRDGQTVPAPPAPPADVPVNLSLNPDATASASKENTGQEAALAIDGNPASRWSSDDWPNSDPNAWITVDLGAEYAVSKVVLSWEAAYAKAYKIQISDDGQTWSDAYSTTTGAGGTETVSVRKDARYVRMQGVTPAIAYGYSLYEMEVYGTALQNPDQTAADAVAALLDALPVAGDVTAGDATQVQAGRAAYDALTADQQKLVPDASLARLVDAEKALADLAEPTVSFTTPKDGVTVSGTVPVRVELGGESLQAYNLRVDSAGLAYAYEPKAGTQSFDLDTTTLTNGVHTLLATATNTAGAKVTVTEKVTVDNPPTLSFTTPKDGATISGTVPVTVVVGGQGLTAYNLRVDAAGLAYASKPEAGDQTFSLDTSTLSNGQHTLLATVTDDAGHKTTVTEKVTVDNAVVPAAWSATTVYLGGETVSYQGSSWLAQWWTQNQKPGDPSGPWEEMVSTADGTAVWTPTRVFNTGDEATYQGAVYVAQWWTRNQAPGDPNGPWKKAS